MEEICNSHLNVIQNNYNQLMKISYRKPDCELFGLMAEGVLCVSGEMDGGSIDDLPSGSFDPGTDFEQIL